MAALELADQLERDPISVQGRSSAMLRKQHADIARLTALVQAQEEAITALLANRGWCTGDNAKAALARIAEHKGA